MRQQTDDDEHDVRVEHEPHWFSFHEEAASFL